MDSGKGAQGGMAAEGGSDMAPEVSDMMSSMMNSGAMAKMMGGMMSGGGGGGSLGGSSGSWGPASSSGWQNNAEWRSSPYDEKTEILQEWERKHKEQEEKRWALKHALDSPVDWPPIAATCSGVDLEHDDVGTEHPELDRAWKCWFNEELSATIAKCRALIHLSLIHI